MFFDANEMTRSFRDNGYLVVPGVLSSAELRQCLAESERLVRLCSDPATKPPQTGVQWEVNFLPEKYRADARGLIRMITPVVDISSVFAAIADKPTVAGPASMLLADGVEMFESKLNLKPPGGSGFVWHQDWSCCWRAHTDELVTCMVYLEDATAATGCLQVVPGSHRDKKCLPFVPNEFEGNGFEVAPGSFDHERITSVPLHAGDMLMFDAYLLHYSDRNVTDNWRRAVLYTYNPARLGRLTDGIGHN